MKKKGRVFLHLGAYAPFVGNAFLTFLKMSQKLQKKMSCIS
jgi:hypothetical protein